MYTKTFTTEEVAKWLHTFKICDSEQEYQTILTALRCMFGANEDPSFWNQVCEQAKKFNQENEK